MSLTKKFYHHPNGMDPYDYIRQFRGSVNEYDECGISRLQTFAWTRLHSAIDHRESLTEIVKLVKEGCDERLLIIGNYEHSGCDAVEIVRRKSLEAPEMWEAYVWLRKYYLQRRVIEDGITAVLLCLKQLCGFKVSHFC